MLSPGVSSVENAVPLVFFYRGSALPPYANVSLSRAQSSWKGPVVLLHDQDFHPAVEGVRCEQFSSWYDPRKFEQFKKKSSLDETFRSGFWFHATERFFVLDQWSATNKIERFAHAELDVDINCRADRMKLLDAWGSGLFYPFGTHEHAGASFLYCNRPQSLQKLLSYLRRGEHAGDEMHGLWDFGVSNPGQVHVLPSHTYFDDRHPELAGLSFVPPEHIGGLFDVQPFGTWLFGQDPRNSPRDPHFNHFLFEEIGPKTLAGLKFRYGIRNGKVSVRSRTSQWFEVLALHIHSKNFGFVVNRVVGLTAVTAANLAFRVPLSCQNMGRLARRNLRTSLDTVYLAIKRIMSG